MLQNLGAVQSRLQQDRIFDCRDYINQKGKEKRNRAILLALSYALLDCY